jgi:hypothetical protein
MCATIRLRLTIAPHHEHGRLAVIAPVRRLMRDGRDLVGVRPHAWLPPPREYGSKKTRLPFEHS